MTAQTVVGISVGVALLIILGDALSLQKVFSICWVPAPTLRVEGPRFDDESDRKLTKPQKTGVKGAGFAALEAYGVAGTPLADPAFVPRSEKLQRWRV